MTDLVVIGAGKFAAEVARYIGDIAEAGPARYRIVRHLAVEEETADFPDGLVAELSESELRGKPVVLAVSDTPLRRKLLDDFVGPLGLDTPNLVHPTALVEPGSLQGVGNVVGPGNYIGANTVLGSFNVVNYHCTIGHHSEVGSNNFFAPNFHCGNSVAVGDDNFFGLGCTVAPEVGIGDGCRFQAGLTLFENAASGQSYLAPNRIKSIPTT